MVIRLWGRWIWPLIRRGLKPIDNYGFTPVEQAEIEQQIIGVQWKFVAHKQELTGWWECSILAAKLLSQAHLGRCARIPGWRPVTQVEPSYCYGHEHENHGSGLREFPNCRSDKPRNPSRQKETETKLGQVKNVVGPTCYQGDRGYRNNKEGPAEHHHAAANGHARSRHNQEQDTSRRNGKSDVTVSQ